MELSQRERVPAYYYQHPQTRAILTLNETLSAQAAAAVEDLQRQFWIDTATWSLPLWEGLEAQHLSWDELEHRCTMLHNRTEGGEPT